MHGGAARMDLSNDLAHCTEWGWATRGPSRVAPLTSSRVMIEGAVRARVLGGVRNLTLLQDTRVTGLLTEREGDRLRVTGITTSRGEQREIRAEFVVDASGRNSKCLEWLEAQKVARPEESLVDSYAGYASRFYDALTRRFHRAQWKALRTAWDIGNSHPQPVLTA